MEVQYKIKFDDYLKKQENLKLENEQIEKLKKKKQIEQEKDEKKRKELMEKRRISNLKYSFKKKYRNYKNEKMHIILKDFEDNKSKTFCIEDISELIKGKTVNIIRDIFTTEIIVTPIKTQLKNFIKNAKRRIKNVKNLNIILVGPSGAGKSTLINKILNVKADIGFGLPVTEKIEMYSSEEIPFLRLVDSRGIEKDPKADINFIYQEISNYIKKQIETNDPDKFIHCIWYCWAADTRLEEVEFNLLKQLGKEYTLDKLPIIIVYTKAISIDSVEKAKKFLKERNIENDFVDILAVEMRTKTNDNKVINVIPPFGLDKLIELSTKRSKEAVNSSCYEGLLREIENYIDETLNKLIEELEESLNTKIKNIISEMDKEIKLENLIDKMTRIIVELFYYFFFLSTDVEVDNQYLATYRNLNLKTKISDKTMNNIQNSVKENLNEFLDIYNKNYSQLLEKIKDELLEEEKNFKTNFLLENKDIKYSEIDIPGETKRNLETFINLNILNKVKTAAFKNFFESITIPIVKQFAIEYKNLYKKALTMDYLKNEMRKIVKISFDEIEEKIKKYYQEKEEKKKTLNEDMSVENTKEKNENKNQQIGLTNDDYNDMFAEDEDFKTNN